MRARTLVAFAVVDARNVRREALLGVVLAAPLLLALVLRLGAAPAEAWAAASHDIDLAAHRPLVLAAVVVLHLPMMCGMVGALLMFDDLDDGALRAVRTTPLTLGRYLAYRVAGVGVFGLAGLLVAVPLSGLVGWEQMGWLLPALVLAAACGPVLMLAALALAGNKVEGLAALKALGLPFMAPLAAWFLAPGWEVLMLPLPSYWPARALWHGLDGHVDWLGVSAGALVLGATGILLARRVHRRALAST